MMLCPPWRHGALVSSVFPRRHVGLALSTTRGETPKCFYYIDLRKGQNFLVLATSLFDENPSLIVRVRCLLCEPS